MDEHPSQLALAAIQMAQHVVEARRARQAAGEAELPRTMQLVKSGGAVTGAMNDLDTLPAAACATTAAPKARRPGEPA